MATRGRPRKPTAIKILDGTFREDRHGDEPKIEALTSLPKPPSSLGKEGKRRWKTEGEQLLAKGILSVTDLPALEVYCAAWDEVQHCADVLSKQGEYSMRDNGTMAAHPAIRRKGEALDRIRAYQREFGMTPSSRTGVKAQKTDESGVTSWKQA